ncbi:MAG: hypothetical protein FWG67_07110 [Defluviitaleaceae bacterium]|nr:hypothetical protein [Defluviitaleaceae bacterium]
MKKRSDVAAFVQAHYDIDVRRLAQLTDKVFKLESSQKAYLLKFANGDEDFVMKQLYAHKELPEVVLPIYETRSGARMAQGKDGFAYLTDYVAQTPMPFESRVRDYAKLLNQLHEATEVTVDKNDDEVFWMYETDYRRLEENFVTLETMMGQYEIKLSRSPFEWQILMMYPLMYGMYRRSDDAMKKFYRLLGRKKQLPIAMTHGDVNVANVLPSAKKNHLINFEHSVFDIPTHDMLKFLSHYHQSSSTTKTITDYLKSQKNQLIIHHFFMKSLCIDLLWLTQHLSGNTLIDISLLNEKLAPGLIAMSIYDEMNAPKKPAKKSEKKNVEKSEDK